MGLVENHRDPLDPPVGSLVSTGTSQGTPIKPGEPSAPLGLLHVVSIGLTLEQVTQQQKNYPNLCVIHDTFEAGLPKCEWQEML